MVEVLPYQHRLDLKPDPACVLHVRFCSELTTRTQTEEPRLRHKRHALAWIHRPDRNLLQKRRPPRIDLVQLRDQLVVKVRPYLVRLVHCAKDPAQNRIEPLSLKVMLIAVARCNQLVHGGLIKIGRLLAGHFLTGIE